MAAAALATTSAMAETHVNVPFAFTVHGKTCPAGQYIIQRDPIHNFVTLMGDKAHVGFNWLLSPSTAPVKDSNLTLSFDKQDAGYALETIQFGSQATPRIDKQPKGTEHRTVVDVQGQ
jgi:hypothetical protein